MQSLIFPLAGYLIGSLPFSIWITHLVKGVDLRDGGSGHAGATNTLRQAGWWWGVVVLILDIAKGFIPVHTALSVGIPNWIVALTAALAVVGHCWPLWANFRGGMGLAVTGGALLAISPLYFLIALGLLIILTLIMRHAARASVFTGILMLPVFWLFSQRGIVLEIAALTGVVIAVRFYSEDWNRKYRELWLDRE
ncbi:MAG: glycerol-3-phosphate acyltransferase [Chloroflexi bacterium]|nr:glycerol-3-phosphate acyltransferase [Chloroflexota bacterium]